MAESLGWGIALGSRFKNDYSGNEVIEDAFRRKAAADAQKEKEAVSQLDFKIDYNKKLPVYGKAIADEQAKIYNMYAQMKQQDKATAFNRILPEIAKAKQKIAAYEVSNDAAMKYINQDGSKFIKEPKLVNAFISHDTTFDDLPQFAKDGYIQVGPQGEFGFAEVPQYPMNIKFEDKEYDVETEKFYNVPVEGKKGVLRTRYPSEETILKKAEQLISDPSYLNNLYYHYPELRGDAKGTLDASIAAVKKVTPEPVQNRGPLVDLPDPDKDEVTSLSLDEAVKAGKVSVDVKQNVLAPQTTYDKSGQAKETKRVASEGNVYFAMDVIDTKPVSVVKSFDVFDVKQNKRLSKDQTGNIVIKPGRIQVIAVKDGKKWVAKPYVYGTATEEGVTTTEGILAGSTKTQTDLQYAVPLESVRNSIELKNDIKWVDEAVQRAQEKIDANYKQGSATTYTINGKKYTLKELQEMSPNYTEETLVQYKD